MRKILEYVKIIPNPSHSVPALDFSLMTYLLCVVLYLMSYNL